MTEGRLKNRLLIEAQSELIELFDDDVNVDITQLGMLHITSSKAPSLDFMVNPIEVVMSSLAESTFTYGTSKAPPKRSTTNLGIVNGVELVERVNQWRATCMLAQEKRRSARV